METIFILSLNGLHSKSTRADFIAGLSSRSVAVQFTQSRQGDFEVVKLDGNAVARAFKSEAAMLAYMAERAA